MTSKTYQRPTEIKGLSTKRRLPRLGKIRLGKKAVSKMSGKEYPVETSYFVVPPEVAKVYGDEPTELDVLFPVEDRSVIAPYAYEFYGSSKGLKRICDGEVAWEMNEKTGEMEQKECVCKVPGEGECKTRMHLMVMLPKVNVGGVYQVDTGSVNSIIDINSSIDWARSVAGRVAMVPLILRREPRETHHGGKKQIHHTLRLVLDQFKVDAALATAPRADFTLAPPVHENPAKDEGATVIDADQVQESGQEGEEAVVHLHKLGKIKEICPGCKKEIKVLNDHDRECPAYTLGMVGANKPKEPPGETPPQSRNVPPCPAVTEMNDEAKYLKALDGSGVNVFDLEKALEFQTGTKRADWAGIEYRAATATINDIVDKELEIRFNRNTGKPVFVKRETK